MLKVDTNYDSNAVATARRSLVAYMEKLFVERYTTMGLVYLLSSNESLVDRFRIGAVMRDVFYSAVPHIMFRSMNMDKTVNGYRRMRTYTTRGNVLIDMRLYPYDNITQTTGMVYVTEDDFDSRFATRYKFTEREFPSTSRDYLPPIPIPNCKTTACAPDSCEDSTHRSKADKRRRRLAMRELNFDIDF
ncbi:unnamed protein product [Ixodes hexagonus]